MNSRRYLVPAVLAGVALACGIAWSLVYQRRQDQKIQDMEATIAALQASLSEKEGEKSAPRSGDRPGKAPVHGNAEVSGGEPAAPRPRADSYQVLHALDVEKLQEMLAHDPGDEAAAIACRFIFDNAADTQGLPDYALQSIYATQSNPDLKRVIAQVMSQRGNDSLLNDRIAEAQAALKSDLPRDRLDALSQLGKLHSVRAVDALAPMLQDADSTVRVAALFALRDNGNQRHIGLAEPMTHDPDPSVSTLAATVVSALKNLSSSARTGYSRADIEAELPPIANP